MRRAEIRIEVDRTVTIRQTSQSGSNQPLEVGDCGINAALEGEGEEYSEGRGDEQSEPWLEITEQVVRRIAIQPSQQTRAKVTILTREALDCLLAYLDSDRERAGQKYELIRQKLVKFFECRGCTSPEEYADATIDHVAVKIADNLVIHSVDPYCFFYGVARNLLKDYWRRSKKEPVSLEDLEVSRYSSARSADLPDYDADQKIEQQLQYLDRCLQGLPPECSELIRRYYDPQGVTNIDNRKLLADRLGIPLTLLRVRVHRIRTSLKQSIAEFLCEAAR